MYRMDMLMTIIDNDFSLAAYCETWSVIESGIELNVW